MPKQGRQQQRPQPAPCSHVLELAPKTAVALWTAAAFRRRRHRRRGRSRAMTGIVAAVTIFYLIRRAHICALSAGAASAAHALASSDACCAQRLDSQSRERSTVCRDTPRPHEVQGPSHRPQPAPCNHVLERNSSRSSTCAKAVEEAAGGKGGWRQRRPHGRCARSGGGWRQRRPHGRCARALQQWPLHPPGRRRWRRARPRGASLTRPGFGAPPAVASRARPSVPTLGAPSSRGGRAGSRLTRPRRWPTAPTRAASSAATSSCRYRMARGASAPVKLSEFAP